MSRAFPGTNGDAEIELRDAARRAARRDGLSLREWLDAAVSDHAATLGLPAADLGDEERLDAVTQRLRELASLGRSMSGGTPSVREARRGRPDPLGVKAPASGKRAEDAAPERLVAEQRPRLVPPAPPQEGFAASRSLPSAPRRDEPMIESRGDAGARSSEPSIDDPNDLGQVEAKLTALFRALDRKPDLASGVRDVAPPRPEKVIAVLEPDPESRAAAPAPSALAAAPATGRTLARAIAEIADRQAVLDRAPAPVETPAQTGLGSAANPGEQLRSPPEEEPAGPPVTTLPLNEGSDSSLEDDRASSGPVRSLEAAVQALTSALDAARQDGVRLVVLAPVERLTREFRAALTTIAPQRSVDELDRATRALGSVIASVAAQGLDAASLKRIRDQTGAVRELLASVVVPAPVDGAGSPGAAIRAPGKEVAQPPTQTVVDPVSATELRSLLNGLRSGQALEPLEHSVGDLSVKIDQLAAGQVQPSAIDQLAERIESVHSSIKGVLASPQPVAAADVASMEAMLSGLIDRFDTMPQNAGDLRTLEDMVHRLATNLENARDPHAGADVLAELQAQVGKLAERIDKSDAGLTAIVSMERSLGELFAQLEETREAAINAAEGAARTAARDTLRAAMLDPGLSARRGLGAVDPAVDNVARELLEFRTARDGADRRLNAMLSTVNQTLEQVVARLVALEDGSARPIARPVPGIRPEAPAVTTSDAEPQPQAPADIRAAAAAELGTAGAADRSRTVFDLGEADFPIEPGTAPVRPRGSNKADTSALDSKADPAQFIAAARRAAQAAAQDSANRSSAAAAARARGGKAAASEPVASSAGRVKSYAALKRRPLLLSLAALVLLLGVAEVAQRTRSAPNAALKDAAVTPPKAQVEQAAVSPAPAAPLSEASRDAAVAAAAAPPASPPAASNATKAVAAAASAPDTSINSLPTLAMGPQAARAMVRAEAAPSGIDEGLRAAAQDGNAAAQYEIGLRYADGRGVARDLKTAAGFFEKAAKQGLAPAAYRLGSLYEKGLGVTRDPAQAIDLYQKAADAGNIKAMHNLAVMSAEGAGGKSDYAKAAQWFAKASQMGVRDSQFNLAILYARGLGIEQSLPQSYTWFAIAAAQGDADAAKKRDEVGARLDPKALATAKAAADEFKPITPLQAANEVKPPPGGWEALAPAHPASGLPNTAGKSSSNARVSTL